MLFYTIFSKCLSGYIFLDISTLMMIRNLSSFIVQNTF
jgi:hypothetical protein